MKKRQLFNKIFFKKLRDKAATVAKIVQDHNENQHALAEKMNHKIMIIKFKFIYQMKLNRKINRKRTYKFNNNNKNKKIKIYFFFKICLNK
jgi:hypothetical protein